MCLAGWREMVCFQLWSSRCLACLNGGPLHLLTHPKRQRVDWSRKLCVCFYSSSHKVQPTERAHAGISKGAGRPPSSQRDNAGRRISHRPSYPWLYSAPAECFRSCLTGSKAAIVSSLCVFVCVRVCVRARTLARGCPPDFMSPHCTQEWACLLCLYFD